MAIEKTRRTQNISVAGMNFQVSFDAAVKSAANNSEFATQKLPQGTWILGLHDVVREMRRSVPKRGHNANRVTEGAECDWSEILRITN